MRWKTVLGATALSVFLTFGIWGAVLTAFEDDAEVVARREALPTMARAGEVSVNNTTLYLWEFEFEGKQCLWATASAGRGGRGGLTCWKETP